MIDRKTFMDADEYQAKAVSTEIYSDAAMEFISLSFLEQIRWLKLAYCAGKLNGEAGEAAEIVFKAFRGNGGYLSGEDKVRLQKELGDIVWYVSNIAQLIGVPLSEIMQQNVDKLQDRKERGVLHGYGDDR